MPCSNISISTSEAIMHRRRMITDYTDIVPITSIRAAAHGETTTRRTFKLSTGGATGKRGQQEFENDCTRSGKANRFSVPSDRDRTLR